MKKFLHQHEKFIGFLLCLMPFLIVEIFILVFGTNVIYADDWDIVTDFINLQDGTLTLQQLFRPHSDHIIFFPRIVQLALYTLTSINTKAIMLLSQLFPLAGLVMMYFVFKKNTGKNWFYFVPAALLLFTLKQWDNQLWAFQIGFYMATFLPILSICLLHLIISGYCKTKPGYIVTFVMSMFFAIIASFSSAHGLLTWPAIVTVFIMQLLTKQKIKPIIVAITAVLGIGCWITYMSISHNSTDIFTLLKTPVTLIVNLFAALGGGIQEEAAACIAGVFVALYIIVLIVLIIKNKKVTPHFAWLAIGAFITMTCLSLTFGRSVHGFGMTLSIRYRTMLIVLPIVLFIATVQLWNEKIIKINLPLVAATIIICTYIADFGTAAFTVYTQYAPIGKARIFAMETVDTTPHFGSFEKSVNFRFGYQPVFRNGAPISFLKENNLSFYRNYEEPVIPEYRDDLPKVDANFGRNDVKIATNENGEDYLDVYHGGIDTDGVSAIYVKVDDVLYRTMPIGTLPLPSISAARGHDTEIYTHRFILPEFDLYQGQHIVSLILEYYDGSLKETDTSVIISASEKSINLQEFNR